jgi:ketosteroid isomerase-like protein
MVAPANERRLRLVRRAYDGMVAGDLDAVVAGTAADVEWRNPERAVEPGIRKGRAEFREALGRLSELFDYDRFEIERTPESGDAVALRVRFIGRGSASGAPIDAVFGHVFRFDGERVVAFEWFPDPADALDAVGAESWPGDPANGS